MDNTYSINAIAIAIDPNNAVLIVDRNGRVFFKHIDDPTDKPWTPVTMLARMA